MAKTELKKIDATARAEAEHPMFGKIFIESGSRYTLKAAEADRLIKAGVAVEYSPAIATVNADDTEQ